MIGRSMLSALAAAVCLLLPPLARDASAQVGKPNDVLNPNRATKEQLVTVPGVDAALADAIIANRPYGDMTAVDRVVAARLDEEQRRAAYVKLFLPINRNAATREEILLVPGAGNRMVREFQEYHPYRALAQFHREIRKYVDEAEVVRFEQYVFVPVDLNTATDEDILSIPGVGARMLREFKEYRPYTDMEQFRREIGKYVSKDEVAMFERYVEIRK
jgi:DNA uptake protein ComE-like DNA-binding protein